MWPIVIITTVGLLLDEGTTAYSSLRSFASLFHKEAHFHQSEHSKHFMLMLSVDYICYCKFMHHYTPHVMTLMDYGGLLNHMQRH